jgi:uncharacterized protein (DUF58 family)
MTVATSNASGEALLWSERAQVHAQGLPALLVRAEKIAATIILGVHGRKQAGPGESFWQYRPYTFGDSTQRIDWRRSAISDKTFIRETEWEAANTLWVWADNAPRMHFKSHLSQETKRDRGMLITLAMASLAVRAHERVGALGSERLPGYGKTALVRAADTLLGEKQLALPELKRVQKGSIALVTSDFLDEPEAISSRIAPLAQSGMKGHLLQIVDPAEETLPYEGRILFEGLDRALRYVSPKTEALRPAYEEKYLQHREAVRALAQRIGWSFSVHKTTDVPMATVLMLYGLLQDHRGKLKGAKG